MAQNSPEKQLDWVLQTAKIDAKTSLFAQKFAPLRRPNFPRVWENGLGGRQIK
jgi:hypothetical protein